MTIDELRERYSSTLEDIQRLEDTLQWVIDNNYDMEKTAFMQSNYFRATKMIEARNEALSDKEKRSDTQAAIKAALAWYCASQGIKASSLDENLVTGKHKEAVYKLFLRAHDIYMASSSKGNFSETFFITMANVKPMVIKPTKDRTTYIANSKLANEIIGKRIDGAYRDFVVTGKFEDEQANMTYILEYDDADIHPTFDEYDSCVLNAVVSLYKEGNTVMNPAMIARKMNGMDKSESVTPGQIEDIIRSMLKLMKTMLMFDATQELRHYPITINGVPIDTICYQGHIIQCDATIVTAGGSYDIAWSVNKMPDIFTHAELRKHIWRVPSKVYAVRRIETVIGEDGQEHKKLGRRLLNTEQIIVVREKLIKRIEGMKGQNALSNDCIRLEDYTRKDKGVRRTRKCLYSLANPHKPDENGIIKPLTRVEKKRIRDDVEAILDYWIFIEYIHGYEIRMENGKAAGYRIRP